MKKILSLLVMTIISVQCWAASSTIIMTSVSTGPNKAPEISTGFSDSSFDYDVQGRGGMRPENKSMCYIGEAAKVCEIIRDYEARMKLQYRRGSHDSITILSCKVTAENNVQTSYELKDDYGSDFRVDREIKSCK
jgi:hypothetical protein